METLFGTLEIENGIAVVKNEQRVDLSTLPSPDPLAFMMGIRTGQEKVNTYRKFENIHGCKFNELASEYIRGYLFGRTGILVAEDTKIRKNQMDNYSLLDKKINK